MLIAFEESLQIMEKKIYIRKKINKEKNFSSAREERYITEVKNISKTVSMD